MKNLLISIIVGLLIALIVVVLIKINSPLGLVIRQGFKQLNRMTLVDKDRVKELENEIKTIRFERDSITKIQRELAAENRSLYLTVDRQEKINIQLNQDLTAQRIRINQLTVSQRLLSPTQNTQLFDNLTFGSSSTLSVLMDGNFVKTPLERIIEANYRMRREKELEEENLIQQKLIENLEFTNNSLRRINSNLEESLLQSNIKMELTLDEKDQYRKLYLESTGKTRKALFITTGVIVIETIVLVWVLTK